MGTIENKAIPETCIGHYSPQGNTRLLLGTIAHKAIPEILIGLDTLPLNTREKLLPSKNAITD